MVVLKGLLAGFLYFHLFFYILYRQHTPALCAWEQAAPPRPLPSRGALLPLGGCSQRLQGWLTFLETTEQRNT